MPNPDMTAEAIGGGYAYVGHGDDCVMLAFHEVGWWRNSTWFKPADARALAAALVAQADAAEALQYADADNDLGGSATSPPSAASGDRVSTEHD